MYNELLERLAKHYLLSDKILHPAFSEEYLTEDGEIDFRYMSRKYKKTWTSAEAKRQLAKYFGRLAFEKQKAVNEVDYKVFIEHYEFGKFPHTRSWITYIFEHTGLILTRKKLHEYILRASTTSAVSSGRNVKRPKRQAGGNDSEWLLQ